MKKKIIKKQAKKRVVPFVKTVNAPTTFGTVQSSRQRASSFPIMAMKGESCIVKNFELSVGFPTGAGFQPYTVIGNPGNPTTFPWLSAIAKTYQKYRYLYLRALYTTTTSTSSTGTVAIQFKYDNFDSDPGSLQSIMAGDSASCGPVWYGGAVNSDKGFDSSLNMESNIFVDLDVRKMTAPWYYVRTGTNSYPTHTSLTGAPTGGIGTLAISDGSYKDNTAFPFNILLASNNAQNSASSNISPGTLYLAYIVEFAEPVDPALDN